MNLSFAPASKCRLLLALLTALLVFRPDAWSAVLTYNSTANLGWFADDAWNGPATWTSGNSAVITSAPASNAPIQFNDSTAATNVSFGTGGQIYLGSAGTNTLTMSGGTIEVTNTSFGTRIDDGVTIQGNFTKTGDGWLRIVGTTRVSAYVGTLTLNAGTVAYSSNSATLGSGSNFIVNAGNLDFLQNNAAIGSMTLNGGNFRLGRTNGDTTFTATLASLAGTGGTILATVRTGGNSTNPLIPTVQTIVVDQSANTDFSGTIQGVTASTDPATRSAGRIAFTKSGSGDLSLSGNIQLVRETIITGGRLYINSINATFANETAGTTAIAVTSGLLGGTGTIAISDNSNVVLGANGQLSAGLVGSAGRTTYALGTGTLDLSSATASANTGWLHFSLGGLTTPGTSYGQILLTSGTLNIGTGLNFEDFSFTALSNFGPGQYVLFDTSNSSILGSLGMSTTGTIGGYDATLAFLGSDKLILIVIPEPHTGMLLLSGIGLLWMARRKRSS